MARELQVDSVAGYNVCVVGLMGQQDCAALGRNSSQRLLDVRATPEDIINSRDPEACSGALDRKMIIA
jgi:hypothetical protein